MAWTRLLIALSFLVVPAASAEPVSFGTPAQMEGGQEGGASWAMVVAENLDSGWGLSLLADAGGAEHATTRAVVGAPAGADRSTTVPASEQRFILEGVMGNYTFWPQPGWQSVLVQADTLEWRLPAARSELRTMAAGRCAVDAPAQEAWMEEGVVRPDARQGCDPAAQAFLASTAVDAPVRLRASGAVTLELHGWDLRCPPGSPCPETGPSRKETGAGPARAIETRYIVVDAKAASVDLTLPSRYFAAGGRQIDVQNEGWTRLPFFQSDHICASRLCDEAGVLQVEGDVRLRGLGPTEGHPGRVDGDWDSAATWARVDETEIDPALASTVAMGLAAGAISAWWLLLKLLPWVLHNQVSAQAALGNGNRRAIYEYIRDRPGPTMREVIDNAPVASGTARFHLRLLVRSGYLIHHRHGRTLRYFENHGRHDDTWTMTVLLREDELLMVHSLVAGRGRMRQTDIIDATARWGWSASTTRYRLNKLVEGRLLTKKPARRGWVYRPTEAVRRERAGLRGGTA